MKRFFLFFFDLFMLHIVLLYIIMSIVWGILFAFIPWGGLQEHVESLLNVANRICEKVKKDWNIK